MAKKSILTKEQIQAEIKRRTAELDNIAVTIQKWEADIFKIDKADIIYRYVGGCNMVSRIDYEYPFPLADMDSLKNEMRENVRKAIANQEWLLKQMTEALQKFIKEKKYGGTI